MGPTIARQGHALPGVVPEDDDGRGLRHRDVPEVHDVQRAALPEHELRAQPAPLWDGAPAKSKQSTQNTCHIQVGALNELK